MIQKMQKTFEILHVPHIDKVVKVPQVQFIDEVVEILEITQRRGPMIHKVDDAKQSRSAAQEAAKTQAALDEKELYREVHKSDTQDTDSRSQACHSQSDENECETSVRRSAKMQKVPNISPQASQTPSAKTGLTRKSHERQPTERRRECLKHDHEAQSQVEQETAAKGDDTRRSRQKKDGTYSKFKIVGVVTRVHDRERKS